MRSKIPLRDRADLSMAYTPGVARVCNAIAADVGCAKGTLQHRYGGACHILDGPDAQSRQDLLRDPHESSE